jgi:N,N'-diacetyllegionaminate synthase
MPVFIIAEAGVNHNGDINLAKQLIDIAVDAGADAVKFQSFSADKLVTQAAKTAAYQQKNTEQNSQYQLLKSLELSVAEHQQLVDYCNIRNIEFMSTAFDNDYLDLLVELGIKRLKSPSGEITNLPYLKQLASKKLPIILSTGMANLAEVQTAVQVIKAEWQRLSFAANKQDLTILHCTSNYPTALADVNLRAMQAMAKELKYPVGYSDHTAGNLVASLAVAMGATVIEKHFTLDKSLPGPDHQASLEPAELTQLVRNIRDAEQSLGDGIKQPCTNELAVRELVRRSVTVTSDLKKGDKLTAADLTLMRPATGIAPVDFEQAIDKILIRDLPAGSTLAWSDIG